MSAQAALVAATRALQAAGIEGAAGDARALLAAAMDVPRDRLTLHLGDDLDAAAAVRFDAMIARRMAREPVAKIIGRRDFWGRSFEVTADVLDPRPETECLIAEALRGPVPARLLDLGTGSGIIAVSLLAEWSGAQGVATDISVAALDVATRNAVRHGVDGRLTLARSDWFSHVTGIFELIVSNPPYIAAAELPVLSPEVRDHDPAGALSDGGDGLAAYRMIAAGAGAHLRFGGRVLLEIGWQQGAQVRDILECAGFANVACLPDLDGRERVIVATWPFDIG